MDAAIDENPPYLDPKAPLETRVEDLAGRLTRDEKVALMAGAAAFALEPVARLSVPSLGMSDGPVGVRSNTGQNATVFPVPVTLAATFNPEITNHVGAAIAREAKALGEQVVLAPTINIVRTPLWGRNFETYSEDPYLAGRLAIGFVEGLQGEGVGASLKHYAVNNQEQRRMDVSVEVDERTLREIYLAAFEATVKAADPWTVMASYNKLRGVHASENVHLLTEILKGEWAYGGVAVSDWGALHSTAPAASAGLDLEMPGPPIYFGDKLLAAVEAGAVEEARIDDAARRLVRLILRTGLLDGVRRQGELRTERHRAVARRAAEEGMVLLKNNGGLLPLDRTALKTLAVIGPNAGRFRMQGDGSSRVTTDRRPSPLDSLRAKLPGVKLVFADGCDNEPFPPQAQASMFSPTAERHDEGLRSEYFADTNFDGAPIQVSRERRLVRWISGLAPRTPNTTFAALRWSGFFWPTQDGPYSFSVRGDGDGWLTVEDQTVITPETQSVVDFFDPTGSPALRRTAEIDLLGGKACPFKLDYVWAKARWPGAFETLTLGVRQPMGTIDQASEVARNADAVVLIVGSASTTESEGYDRPDMDLPGRQNELVTAICGANAKTVVVVNTGAAMTMPWVDEAHAVLQAWLPGEAGCDALAGILLGDVSPSGRLPVTFPRRIEDSSAYGFYPGGDSVEYGEGLMVGYRHHDKSGVKPLFPFGHGLTYSSFDYADLTAPKSAARGAPVEVSLTLGNIGDRAAKETVQLYVAPVAPSKPGAPKALKAFAKVTLDPGERRAVAFTLDQAAFAYFDDGGAGWTTEAGDYDILVGASAEDIRLKATVRLT